MRVLEYKAQFASHLEVECELPDEGILRGPYGEFRFKRVEDGLAVYESTFLGSGFVCAPTSADIFVPETVNQNPIVELHQTVNVGTLHPVAIEGSLLKRIDLHIQRATLQDKIQKQDNALLLFMLQELTDINQRDNFTELEIHFYCKNGIVDVCSITCNQKCILTLPNARTINVHAPVTILKGQAPHCAEQINFSGKIYPFVYQGWDSDEPNAQYFENLPHLRYVDGSLHGDTCWSFKNCVALERVHLSDGILTIPPCAFQNCTSLTDLYVPDTVREIGEYAFCGCTSLATIHLPANIKRISRGMFQDCRALQKCYLADSIEEICDSAFSGCLSLRKPWLPKKIKRISTTAFDDPSWCRF